MRTLHHAIKSRASGSTARSKSIRAKVKIDIQNKKSNIIDAGKFVESEN